MPESSSPIDQEQNWDRFCDTLREAGKQIAQASPADERDRAEGYRYLARLSRYALANLLEPQDPSHPEVSFDTPRIGGDNPDYLYCSIAVSPHYRYRLHGCLKDAANLGIGAYSGGLGTTAGLRCEAYLTLGELTLRDGCFEIEIGDGKGSGDRLALTPKTNSILIRQTLLNRRRQQPATIRVARVDHDESRPPPPLDPAQFAGRLQMAGSFINGVARQFLGWTRTFESSPNQIQPLPPKLLATAQGDPNTRYYNGYYDLPEGSALVAHLRLPECSYWNIQATNHWLESLDYQHHNTVVNIHNADHDEDGCVTVIIGPDDPGRANWVDTIGHSRGCIAMRCVGAETDVGIECSVQPLCDRHIRPRRHSRQTFSAQYDTLHEQATTATGLDDFGPDEYTQPLKVLLDALDRANRLDNRGWLRAQQLLLTSLAARLLSQASFTAHPEVSRIPLEKPIFLIGLPRTGTTALHKILCADPSHQGLEYWLGNCPRPRPPRAGWEDNPMYQQVAQGLHELFAANPRLRAIHNMAADQPDECRLLLMQSFANVTFHANMTAPDYAQWLYDADLTAAYTRYRHNLQLIGSTSPDRRWVLKDPSHLWAPNALLQQFPDACIVQTHRDPVQLIPSVTSLVFEARRRQEPDLDPREIGPEQLHQWQQVWDRTITVRDQIGDARFFDLHFDEFRTNPLGTVRDIYTHFQLDLSTEAQAAMQRQVEANPPNKHGDHSYSAGDFGLQPGTIRNAFAHYRKRFAVG